MTRLFFTDELFDAQLLRAVSAEVFGGAQIGECLATAKRIKEVDLTSWHDEWTAAAETASAAGEAAITNHRAGAAKILRPCAPRRSHGRRGPGFCRLTTCLT